MKNLLSLLISIFLLTSCVVTQKQRDKFCGNSCPEKIVIKDSIVKTIEYRDTTIYVSTPAITYTIENPCDSTGKLKEFTKTEKKYGIKINVVSKNNKLVITCEADSLKQVIKALNERVTASRYKSETKVIKEYKTRGIDYFCRWFCVLIIAYFILKNIKFKLPL